ncbi:MAG: hypothetical protein QOG10_529, partial [Kribbellaceae bacterium]|nr:hypothetical protein [Kribbellaceae bacterium]
MTGRMKPSVHAAPGEPGAYDAADGRRPLALRRNLIVIGALTVILPLLIVFTALVGFVRSGQASAEASRVRTAQRFQIQADLWHDEIRADVLSALLAGGGHGVESRRDVVAHVTEHVEGLRSSLAQTRGVSSDLDRAVQHAGEPLSSYMDQAILLVPLAFSDPAAALAQLPTFERKYHQFEATQESLTNLFSDAATKADARARRAETQGERGVVGVGIGAIAALFSLAVMLNRLGTTNNRLLTRLRGSAAERAAGSARLDAAQELAHVGSWEADPQTDEAQFSDELFRILGLVPQDGPVSVELWWDHVHPEDRQRVRETFERAIAAGKPTDGIYRVVRADGRVRDVHSRATATLDESGRSVRVAGTVQDVTEQRAVDRMKDEFVSVISHELRTPLTSIRGALGLLAGGALGQLTDKAQRMTEIAVASSERLVRLINDILDVERMEAGEL